MAVYCPPRSSVTSFDAMGINFMLRDTSYTGEDAHKVMEQIISSLNPMRITIHGGTSAEDSLGNAVLNIATEIALPGHSLL